MASSRDERSIAMTVPSAPTRWAAGIAEAPLPQPASSTDIPGRTPARTTSWRPTRDQSVLAG
jgi:hypothetical protein